MLLTSFRNTRARLQRLSDLRFFAGWARDLTPEAVMVLFVGAVLPEAGDNMHVHLTGNMVAAVFGAKVVLVRGKMAQLNFTEPPRFIASSEDMRVWAGETRAIARSGPYEFAITVLDISLRGIGVLSTDPWERGDLLDIEYATPHGEVRGTAEVRYCRRSAEDPDVYRAGLMWTHMDRLSSARWHKVVDNAKLVA